ncbi:MAG: helix-hairpin-helix domain-containing protein [Prevotella sp.]|nr:helix-hairpin-helix domain-containing protein [Candidatus Equicola stercoris]
MNFNNFRYYKTKDRVIIATLIILIVGFIFFFHYGGQKMRSSKNNQSQLLENNSRSYHVKKGKHVKYYNIEGRKVEVFYFDPNTADSTHLLRLGLQPWQVRNIYKYRAAGGVYRYPEDFARLYGLTKKDWLRLKPYIRISDDYKPAADFVKNDRNMCHQERAKTTDINIPSSNSIANTYNLKIKKGETISLGGDTTDFQRVPGIGPYFARQIKRYGERLGGYVNTSQLLEIENFPEEAVNFFTPSEKIVKINVNKATLSQMRRHPYINYYQAKEIIDYHRLNGPLKSLDELRFSRFFSQKDIERIKPYIEY